MTVARCLWAISHSVRLATPFLPAVVKRSERCVVLCCAVVVVAAASEEELRAVLEPCGDIENVRIVRDASVNLGKGFAFVTFVVRRRSAACAACAALDSMCVL
jgi:hypothetical protein